jgi:hypothetical protein
MTWPCPNPKVTCTNCGASVHGCTCRGKHVTYTVPICGACCAVGGEPDPSAWERVEKSE